MRVPRWEDDGWLYFLFTLRSILCPLPADYSSSPRCHIPLASAWLHPVRDPGRDRTEKGKVRGLIPLPLSVVSSLTVAAAPSVAPAPMSSPGSGALLLPPAPLLLQPKEVICYATLWVASTAPHLTLQLSQPLYNLLPLLTPSVGLLALVPLPEWSLSVSFSLLSKKGRTQNANWGAPRFKA